MEKKTLPYGTQFTPNQIDIMKLLKVIEANEGVPAKDFADKIEKIFFLKHAADSRKTMAFNCRQSLVSYGILKEGGGTVISDFGRKLISLSTVDEVYEEIASFLLRELNGMVLIEAIRSLKRSGLSVKNETVIEQVNYLLGSDLIGSGNNVQSAKLWLEKANILSGWNINESKLQKLIGLTEEEMQLIRLLTPEQYYFLRTLCNVNSNKYLKGAEVRKLAEATYHITISPKSIAPSVILPLEKEKLIVAKKPTSGRGGASYLVKATAKSKKKLIEPLFKQIEILLGKDLLDYYQKPLSQIRKDMSSRNTYVKGLALEAFAIRLMKYIGLDFHSTRLRGTETAGAEIDAIFESSHLIFTRWQVQCKNIKKASSVSLDQVAKEVGLSHVLLSNAIVIMTTGKISESARKYADDVMRTMNICIIMIDGEDLDEIVESPTNIIDIFNRESLNARHIKVLNSKKTDMGDSK